MSADSRCGVLVTQRAALLVELLPLSKDDRIDHRLGDGKVAMRHV